MADEEEVDGQVPGLPVLFEVAAVPPVHIEVSISEADEF